jgi:thiosulfate dehydrogenase (quinone) large subunit
VAVRHPRRADDRTNSPHRIATAALMPLRVFLGGTFLYAGLYKLLDPGFLASSGVDSIGQQLHGFALDSPLAFLINGIALRAPVLVGLGMALLEIAIGLGTLAGWLFRLSAAMGTAVALLFWLTASWATKPYFLGADLPYAAGWLTLALAGDGGAWTLERWLAVTGPPRPRGGYSRTALRRQAPVSVERRRFLQVVGLGAAALAVAGPSFVIGRIAAATGPTATATRLPTIATPTAAPSSAPSETSTTTPGMLLAKGADLASAGSVTAVDPVTGDPVLVIKLSRSSVVAYDAVCTHAGCTVEYDPSSVTMICPCHGAQFDPAHQGRVMGGPTDQPLAVIPIRVDPKTGDVTTMT